MGRGGAPARAGRRVRALSAPVRIGTCSWADETLTKVWYPGSVKTSEARLGHYAARFDTVELNSSYYALPSPDAAAASSLLREHEGALGNLSPSIADALQRTQARAPRPLPSM